MPTYVYRCPECANEFERFERITAEAARCPSCGTPAERRISGGAGMVVKGAAVPPPPPGCCGGGACGMN